MKLLVLDLDETLIYANEAPLDRVHDFMVGPYFVYKRPHFESFINRMSDSFKLAVWTSSNEGYAKEMVAHLFSSSVHLQFVWSRSRCTRRYFVEQHESEWTKNLRKVKQLGFSLDEVIMVDDTPSKLFRSYGNLVHVNSYWGQETDSELLLLADYLPTLCNVISVRTIEKRFWRINA